MIIHPSIRYGSARTPVLATTPFTLVKPESPEIRIGAWLVIAVPLTVPIAEAELAAARTHSRRVHAESFNGFQTLLASRLGYPKI